MKKQINRTRKMKAIALSEIFLMVMTTVAVAFLIQQSFGLVSAAEYIQTGNIVNGKFIPSVGVSGEQGAIYGLDDKANIINIQTGKKVYTLSDEDVGSPGYMDATPISAPGANGAKTPPAATPLPTGAAGPATSSVVQKGFMTDKGAVTGSFVQFSDVKLNGATEAGTYAIKEGKIYQMQGGVFAPADSVNKADLLKSAGYTQQSGITKLDGFGEVKDVSMYKDGTKAVVTTNDGKVMELAKDSTTGKWTESGANVLNNAALAKGLFEGVVWAGVAFGLVNLLAGAFGARENLKLALSASLAVGVLVYKTLATLSETKVLGKFWGGTGAVVGGLAAAALVFFLLYKEQDQRIINFECQPYQPPLGGKQCEDCNKYPFKPCSEYRCKSLGQACELLNVGTTNESCTWVSKFDVKSPIISTLKEALYPTNLVYNPDTSRPSGLGSKIIRTGGNSNCLQAFTPLKFGITTNEPSQCRIDYGHTNSYANMSFMFGESSLFLYNHTQSIRLPAPVTNSSLSGSPTLTNGVTSMLYVRCVDANGNENVDEYTFGFCIDESPDTTPPIVQSTSILSGSPVQFNVSSVPIQVYTNEPATCKWSRTNKDYIDMENNMGCSNTLMKVNSDLVYTCSGNLTSIKDREDNNFYFRCKDQPNKAEKDRNVMSQSYTLVLKGSQPLNILKAGPNGTIFGSTDIAPVSLTIETDDGADEGKAWCSYSPSGLQDSYVQMYNTNNSFNHIQQLDLAAGSYNYYYRCIDNGGNRAETNVTFNVFVDRAMPLVTRAYKEVPDALKIVTNEDAECAYSLTSCNFNFIDGKKLIYNPPTIKNVQLAEWKDSSIYYIKCRDFYGNEPSPNQCNIVVSTSRISGGN